MPSVLTSASSFRGLALLFVLERPMNSELEAIKDAWDKDTGEGRDKDGTLAMCDGYVAAHPEQFTTLKSMSLEECVNALSVFRNAGMDEDQWKVEVWLLHHFEPQQIGGPVRARIRLPGSRG